MVIVGHVVITGMVTAGAIRAGGISAIRRVARCHRRTAIMEITAARIMITDAGRIAVTDTTGVAVMMIIMAGMAITVINPANDRNKNGTAQTVPFFIARRCSGHYFSMPISR